MLPKTVKAQIKRADKVSAWLEAIQIAGFSELEANKFFGRPREPVVENLAIVLRPPVEARRAYKDRFEELMARI
jgi:hypothetical protein